MNKDFTHFIKKQDSNFIYYFILKKKIHRDQINNYIVTFGIEINLSMSDV